MFLREGKFLSQFEQNSDLHAGVGADLGSDLLKGLRGFYRRIYSRDASGVFAPVK